MGRKCNIYKKSLYLYMRESLEKLYGITFKLRQKLISTYRKIILFSYIENLYKITSIN